MRDHFCGGNKIQSTSAISNTRYLKLSLCGTFYLVPSIFSLIFLINPFGTSNSVISNFHYVEQFSLSLFLDCFWAVSHQLSRTVNHTVFEWIILSFSGIRILITARVFIWHCLLFPFQVKSGACYITGQWSSVVTATVSFRGQFRIFIYQTEQTYVKQTRHLISFELV